MSAEEKRQLAVQLVERGLMHVHLDPRRPGVVVPERFTHQPALVLAYGRSGLRVPIVDLVVDDDGIRATLSFSNTPFACTVPWSSIFALVDVRSRGRVFPEDLPSDLTCGFCLESTASALLVAAPHASICERCIDVHRPRGLWRRLRAWLAPRSARPGRVAPYRDAAGDACSFCDEVKPAAIRGHRAQICSSCLALVAERLAGMRAAASRTRVW